MAAHDLPPVTGNGEHATVKLSDYLAAVRAGDVTLAEERDRRYAEVKAAEEKALKVKETADAIALGLQRDYQRYKDEKANELREQINTERGTYVTRQELKPVLDYVAGRVASTTDRRLDVAQLFQVISLLIVAAGVIFAIVRG